MLANDPGNAKLLKSPRKARQKLGARKGSGEGTCDLLRHRKSWGPRW